MITSRDPAPAARRLRQGLGRPVPRHDDPRLRHGALSRRRHRRGAGDRAPTSSTRRSRTPATSTPPWWCCARPRGALVHINNSRRCAYGYDQRIEAFGEKGMLQAGNRRADHGRGVGRERHRGAMDPVLDFFIERYAEAYLAEIDHFVDCVETGRDAAGRLRRGARGAAPGRRGAGESRKSGRSGAARPMTGTVRLTAAQALVRYLAAQRTIVDGREVPLFAGCLGDLRPRQRRRASARRCTARATRCRPSARTTSRRMAHAAIAFAKAQQPPAHDGRAPPRSAPARPTW